MFIEIIEEDRPAERSEQRMKVLLTGELRTRRFAAPCRIHDISRRGACLDAAVLPAIGETVSFHRGRLAVEGTIAWVCGKKFGMAFDQPIRATDLLIQMSHSRGGAGPAQDLIRAVPLSAAATPRSPSR